MGRYYWLKQGVGVIGGVAIASCTQFVIRPSSPDVSSTSRPVSSSPSQSLPVADANGDYRRTHHQNWRVVDSDPSGLNCRWSAAMPTDWYSPSTQLPNQNFGQWQVVRTFSAGTTLTANLAPAGFALFYDEQQKPWLKVSISRNEQICLVRANTAYVEPIAE